jgi:tungstate transport system ATP-binding protein
MLDRVTNYSTGKEACLDGTKGANRLFPLVCSSLTYSLNRSNLVDNVDLTLQASGISVIMGFNGAGKSLLLRLLHGMLAPTKGTIRWGGHAMCAAIRKRQAMVFQKPVLLRRSVRGNIDFILSVRGERDKTSRDRILDEVGLLTLARRPARRLSGGEQQRLALARALACRPDVLFLDEATASLDPASIRYIEAIVRNAAEAGTKIIFVTHDIGQARRLADEVIFIHRGRVVEQATAESFFDGPESREAQAYLDGRIMI